MDIHPHGIHQPTDEPEPERGPEVSAAVEEVERALQEERFEDALDLAESALAEGSGDALDLTFLAGDALLALGEFEEAEDRFREVLAEDSECPSSRCWLAMALYRQLRFEEAEEELLVALSLPDALPDCHVVRGMLLERQGRFEEADRCFGKASELAPELYKAPIRLSREEFDREVVEASQRLPEDFHRHLEHVPVIVQDVPSMELLIRDDDLRDPDLLGLFDGPTLADGTSDPGGFEPAAAYIYLFQRNLERYATDQESLREQIAITLYHELGHYLGFDEEGLDRIGLA